MERPEFAFGTGLTLPFTTSLILHRLKSDLNCVLPTPRSYRGTNIMIASVVATLEDGSGDRRDIVTQISNLPCVEVGNPGDNLRRIPITIDSPAPNALEDVTRQIQQCHGVAFVDVVFVHFEDASVDPPLTSSRKPNHS